MDASLPPRPRTRFWLYAPFAALVLLAGLWSIAWIVIRSRTTATLDAWLEAEAGAGRRWTCADRSVGGYPFRLEIGCASVSLDRPEGSAKLGRLVVVAQVYEPGHFVAEATGPLQASIGPVTVEANWRLFQASLRTGSGGFQRASLVEEAPNLKVTAPPGTIPLIGDTLAFSGQRLETHVRPNPTDATAFDWALRATGAVVPDLDGLIGGKEPADIDLDLTATQMRDARARPPAEELERWRQAGGSLAVQRLGVGKGARRIEGRAQFALDERHRPRGNLELSATKLDGVLGELLGGTGGALLSILAGPRAAAPASSAPAGPGGPLRPLPTVTLDNGRVLLGPIAVPGLRLTPLY